MAENQKEQLPSEVSSLKDAMLAAGIQQEEYDRFRRSLKSYLEKTNDQRILSKVENLQPLSAPDQKKIEDYFSVLGRSFEGAIKNTIEKSYATNLQKREKERATAMNSRFLKHNIKIIEGAKTNQVGQYKRSLDVQDIERLIDAMKASDNVFSQEEKTELETLYTELKGLTKTQAEVVDVEVKELKKMLQELEQEIQITTDAVKEELTQLSSAVHTEKTIELAEKENIIASKNAVESVNVRKTKKLNRRFVETYFKNEKIMDNAEVKNLMKSLSRVNFATAVHMFHKRYTENRTVDKLSSDKTLFTAKNLKNTYNYDVKGVLGNREIKALTTLYGFFTKLFEAGYNPFDTTNPDNAAVTQQVFDLFYRTEQGQQSRAEMVAARHTYETVQEAVDSGSVTSVDAFFLEMIPDFNRNFEIKEQGFKNESQLFEELRLAQGSLSLELGQEAGEKQLCRNVIDILLLETQDSYGRLYGLKSQLESLRATGSFAVLHKRIYDSHNEQVFLLLQDKLKAAGRHTHMMLRYGPTYADMLAREQSMKTVENQDKILDAILNKENAYELTEKVNVYYERVLDALRTQVAEAQGEDATMLMRLLEDIKNNEGTAKKRIRIDMMGLIVSMVKDARAAGGFVSLTSDAVNDFIAQSKIFEKMNVTFAPMRTETGPKLYAGVSFSKSIALAPNSKTHADHKLWYSFGVGAAGGLVSGKTREGKKIMNGFLLPTFFGSMGADFQTNAAIIEKSLDERAANYLGFSFTIGGVMQKGRPLTFSAGINVFEQDKLKGLEQRRLGLEKKFTQLASLSTVNGEEVLKQVKTIWPKTKQETLLQESKRIYAVLQPFGKNRATMPSEVKTAILGEIATQYALAGYDDSLEHLEGDISISRVAPGVTYAGIFRLPQLSLEFTKYHDLQRKESEESKQALVERSKTGALSEYVTKEITAENVGMLNTLLNITDKNKQLIYSKKQGGHGFLWISDALLDDPASGINLSTYNKNMIFREEGGFVIPSSSLGIQALVFNNRTQYHLIAGGKGLEMNVKDTEKTVSALPVTTSDKDGYGLYSQEAYEAAVGTEVQAPTAEDIHKKFETDTVLQTLKTQIGLTFVRKDGDTVVFTISKEKLQAGYSLADVTINMESDPYEVLCLDVGKLSFDLKQENGSTIITAIGFDASQRGSNGEPDFQVAYTLEEVQTDTWGAQERLTSTFPTNLSSEVEAFFTSPNYEQKLLNIRYSGGKRTGYTAFRNAMQRSDWQKAADIANNWNLIPGYSFDASEGKREDLRRLSVELCIVYDTVYKHFENSNTRDAVIDKLVDDISLLDENRFYAVSKFKTIAKDIMNGELPWDYYESDFNGVLDGTYTTHGKDMSKRPTSPEYKLYRMVAPVASIHARREKAVKQRLEKDGYPNGDALRSTFTQALNTIENTNETGKQISEYATTVVDDSIALVFGYPKSSGAMEELFTQEPIITAGARPEITDSKTEQYFFGNLVRLGHTDMLQGYVNSFNEKMKHTYSNHVDVSVEEFIQLLGAGGNERVRLDAKIEATFCATCLNETLLLANILMQLPAEPTLQQGQTFVRGERVATDGVWMYVGSTEQEGTLQQKKFGIFGLFGNLNSPDGYTIPGKEEGPITIPGKEEVTPGPNGPDVIITDETIKNPGTQVFGEYPTTPQTNAGTVPVTPTGSTTPQYFGDNSTLPSSAVVGSQTLIQGVPVHEAEAAQAGKNTTREKTSRIDKNNDNDVTGRKKGKKRRKKDGGIEGEQFYQ